MRRLRALGLRLAAVVRPGRIEDELAAEIESHLQLHVDDNIRAGMPPHEARRQAVLALGGIESAKERYRDRRGLPMLEALLQDLRFGVRLLRKHPMFTIVAAVTLAVGLGPTTIIYALANWALLRPVPGIASPDDVGLFMTGTRTPRGTMTSSFVSYPNYHDVASRIRTVNLAGYQRFGALVSREGEASRRVVGQFVTASYFDVLGVRMQAGRAFRPDEDDPAAPALVGVISSSLWSGMFGRDPSAIGALLRINGHLVTIVGVAAEGFRGLDRIGDADLWVPGGSQARVSYRPSEEDTPPRARDAYYQWVARLRSGFTWPQAETELSSQLGVLAQEHPAENGRFAAARFHFSGPVGSAGAGQRFRPMLNIAVAVMGIVLLMTCANVASLLLLRGIARRDEVATRIALGANRWRLVRQHVTEGLMLWALGAVVGGVLLALAVEQLAAERFAALGVPPIDLTLDWRVALFTGLLTLAVGLFFSVVPALRVIRPDVVDALKCSSGLTSTRPNTKTGSILTVVQLSASLAMLVGALLLAATLRHLTNTELGFQPSNVTVATLNPGVVGLDPQAAEAFYRSLLERLDSHPAIERVAWAKEAPLTGGRSRTAIRRAGDEPEASLEAWVNQVLSTGYFGTLGIPVIHGRAFTRDEIPAPGTEGRRAVMLNEVLARQLFGTSAAAGRFVEFRQRGRTERYEVVGVTANIRFFDLTDDPVPIVFDPRGLSPGIGSGAIVVRGAVDAEGGAAIREAVAGLNSAVPFEVATMSSLVQRARTQWDVLTWLIGGLAAVATILSAVGVYGLVAFNAAARRREFGIRAAYGAAAGVIRRLVLRGALVIGAAGVLVGLAASYALVRVLENQLVGVQPFNLLIWGAAAALLVAIVGAAALIPAHRASRVSPSETLRAM